MMQVFHDFLCCCSSWRKEYIQTQIQEKVANEMVKKPFSALFFTSLGSGVLDDLHRFLSSHTSALRNFDGQVLCIASGRSYWKNILIHLFLHNRIFFIWISNPTQIHKRLKFLASLFLKNIENDFLTLKAGLNWERRKKRNNFIWLFYMELFNYLSHTPLFWRLKIFALPYNSIVFYILSVKFIPEATPSNFTHL